ncbi:uncharacterized protein N7458_002532 [Penicillium daleae]|uniref:Clr5 domain-containing protein n=1 Tax=Penicillium daleae TaxID=63821 RepID=A0AAD6CD04_9EURO|nr:uncharacterized protein N7458_002532 [Penicillium daleae]KAJ5460980.1 hypothetical protein N7458_002532 [Penicillium daleae]
MVRPQIDLNPYKDEIMALFNQQKTTETICIELSQRHSINISYPTLARRLQAWGLRRLPSKTADNQALCDRIRSLVRDNYSDKEILPILQREGFKIAHITLKRPRQQLSLRLRTDDPEARRYGRGLLYTYLRQKGHTFPRDRVFSIYRNERPDALRRRTLDLQRQRQAYQSPGPNHVWHMDGYMKLAPFGIEIYAAIDGYSRYILWVYIGISTRSAISVYKQYVNAVSTFGYLPQILRTDLGGETIYLGDAHWALRRVANPDIPHTDCYSYGKSTENTRIEAWWAQLSRSSVFIWRNYFATLRDERLFSITSIADQIALLAVFMPTVRSSISSYVETWNRHTIRKQPKRPWVAYGKPIFLYQHSSRQDVQQLADPALLQTLQQDVANWDADEYLPIETLLQEIGFDPLNPPPRDDSAQPYKSVYLELRQRAILHTQSGNLPILQICERPTQGNWENWQEGR